MWQCASCEYWNEEWDEACAKCGTERISRDHPEEPVAAGAGQGGQPEQHRRFGALEWAATAVIVVCLGVLGYLGYVYFARGGFNLNLSMPQVNVAQPVNDTAAPEFDPRQVALETDHPLASVYNADLRSARAYIPYADKLVATEYAIQTVALPQESDTEIDYTGLDQLRELTDSLLESYGRFEADCREGTAEELVPFQQLIRSCYSLRFDELLAAIGAYYILDGEGVHPAYLLSDAVPAAVEPHDPDLALRLTQRWAAVVFDRSQHELNQSMAAEIAELQSWLEAMTVLHRGFQVKQAGIPPYDVRNGIIDGNAKLALEALDELMTDVESLATGFEEYRQGIGDLGRSNRIKNLCSQFEQLAQTDHAYGFEEIYKIYVQDRSLTHPVYDRLKQHYDFVAETWPELQVGYRVVFNKYENEWADRWAN